MAIWENWTLDDLRRGTLVRAVKNVDPSGADAQKGDLGVVFEESQYHEPNSGPMVCWFHGGRCNVYEGDVEIVSKW